MMTLVPTSNSNNAGAEKMCDMLQEVMNILSFFPLNYIFLSQIRDEFRTLKTFVSKQQQDKNSDTNNLSEMLARAEHTVKVYPSN